MERDFKGVWIPKEIWLSKELSMIEKVLLTEISSLDNENHCVAGNDYFAEFCNCSASAITKAIKHLKELGYIEELEFNGRRRKLRVVNFTRQHRKIYEAASENLRDNNINSNTKKNTISINRNSTSLVKNKNLYEKCSDVIKSFNFPSKLEKVIYEYLSLRLKMTDKPIYNQTQWRAILNKLVNDLAPDDVDLQIAIVKQSIERGYASVFPVNSGKSTRSKSYNKGISCEQYTEEEEQEIRNWQKEVIKNGGRVKY